MPLQLQPKWEGRTGRINVAKLRIEPLQTDTVPVHSVPYRGSPKTREFDQAKINELLSEKLSN